METRLPDDNHNSPSTTATKPRLCAPFPLSPPHPWARLDVIDKMLGEIAQPPHRDMGKKRTVPGPYPTPPSSTSDPGSVSPFGTSSTTPISISSRKSSHPLNHTPSLPVASESCPINSAALRYKPPTNTPAGHAGLSGHVYSLDTDDFELTDGIDFLSLGDRTSRPRKRARARKILDSEDESEDGIILIDPTKLDDPGDAVIHIDKIAKPHGPCVPTSDVPLSQLKDESPDLPFELAYFPTKGFGLRARRPFTKGEIIVQESPFFEIATDEKHLVRQFALSDDPARAHLRTLFLSFTATVPDIDDIYLDILETNCLDCSVKTNDEEDEEQSEDDNQDEDGEESDESYEGDEGVNSTQRRRSVRLQQSRTIGKRPKVFKEAAESQRTENSDESSPTVGLFRYISRVSHSCSPNSGWRWDNSLRQHALRAFRDIAAGEEITASYLSTAAQLLPREERIEKLRTNFGFDCACPDCAPQLSFVPITTFSPSASSTKQKGKIWTFETCAAYSARMDKKERLRERYQELKEEWGSSVDDPDELQVYAMDKVGALDAIDRTIRILDELDIFAGLGDPLGVRFAIHAAWKDGQEAKRAAEEAYEFFRIRDGEGFAVQTNYTIWRRDPTLSKDHWGQCIIRVDRRDAQDHDYNPDQSDAGEEEEYRRSKKRKRDTKW